MMASANPRARLQFLVRVVRRECDHVSLTDKRLFSQPFTVERVRKLDTNVAEAEQVEAFVARFSRLQDTLGDKLLPCYLEALGERPGAALDNLDRAERLGLLPSADHWFAVRNLRNQMIHEYIEDPLVLADALQRGHEFLPTLLEAATVLGAAIEERGWLAEEPK